MNNEKKSKLLNRNHSWTFSLGLSPLSHFHSLFIAAISYCLLHPHLSPYFANRINCIAFQCNFKGFNEWLASLGAQAQVCLSHIVLCNVVMLLWPPYQDPGLNELPLCHSQEVCESDSCCAQMQWFTFRGVDSVKDLLLLCMWLYSPHPLFAPLPQADCSAAPIRLSACVVEGFPCLNGTFGGSSDVQCISPLLVTAHSLLASSSTLHNDLLIHVTYEREMQSSGQIPFHLLCFCVPGIKCSGPLRHLLKMRT